MKELDAFVLSCCGQHILEDGMVSIELPKNMKDDDIFEFVQRAGIQKYHLFEFDGEPIFYGVWLLHQQKWLKYLQETGWYLMYDLSEEKLFNQLHNTHCIQLSENDILYEYKGTIDSIIESPTLFKTILRELKWAEYDEIEEKLTISSYDFGDIQLLNPLLKKPIFSVKTLSLAEVLQIEQNIKDEEQSAYALRQAEYDTQLAKNNSSQS